MHPCYPLSLTLTFYLENLLDIQVQYSSSYMSDGPTGAWSNVSNDFPSIYFSLFHLSGLFSQALIAKFQQWSIFFSKSQSLSWKRKFIKYSRRVHSSCESGKRCSQLKLNKLTTTPLVYAMHIYTASEDKSLWSMDNKNHVSLFPQKHVPTLRGIPEPN